MSKSLPVHWTKSISDPKKKVEMEAIIRNSVVALSRLYDLIEEKEITINNQEVSPLDFDSPSWSHKTAFRLGQKAALKEIRSLLEFIK